jgi:putative endonuclease
MKDLPAFFYVIYSPSIDRYYSGITTEEIQTRLFKHNSSFHGSHFTSAASDWELRLLISCDSYTIARKIELYVKRMKSRKFIEKIIQDSTERDFLISKIKST